jgi:hypothetical protein
MYKIFRLDIADHQGGSCDSYHFIVSHENLDEAVSSLTALNAAREPSLVSWERYILMADQDTIDELRDDIADLQEYIDELDDYRGP